MHNPSFTFRATTSLTLSVLFFALAIGLWSYRSDRLGISADLTVTHPAPPFTVAPASGSAPLSVTATYALPLSPGQETFTTTASGQLPNGWNNESAGGNVSVGVKPGSGEHGTYLGLVDTNSTPATNNASNYAGVNTTFPAAASGSVAVDVFPHQGPFICGQECNPPATLPGPYQFGISISSPTGQFIYVYLMSDQQMGAGHISYWCDTCQFNTTEGKYRSLGGSWQSNNWYRLGVTWNSSTFDVTLNGTKLNSSPIAYSYPQYAGPASRLQLFTGYEPNSRGFSGSYDVDNVSYPGHTNPVTNLTWDFGDGTVVQNAPAAQTHIYQNPGTYTVNLSVNGQSAGSQTVTVTSKNTAPSAPTNLTSVVVSDTRIDLNWSDQSNNETGFRIERSPNGTSNWTPIATVTANLTFYQNTGLTAATLYYYRVFATGSVTDSGPSNIISATTQSGVQPLVVPTAPINLTAPTLTDSQVTLSWQDTSSNESCFKIERRLASETEFKEIATLPANSTTYTDKSVAANTNYVYRVRACNAAGNSGYSNELAVKTKTTNTTTKGTAKKSTSQLTATGGSLPFNLMVAAILSALVTYFLIFHRRRENKN